MLVKLEYATSIALVLLCVSLLVGSQARGGEPLTFNPEQLATQLQVGYAVRAVDVNADGQLDIAIVDSKRVLWLENPSWKEHVVYATPDAQFDNVCFAPHDINRDGRIDFALGADWQPGNSDSGGTIGWLEHTSAGPWTYRQLASEPTTHRMNWVELRSGRPELVVAPLKGRGTRGPGFEQTGVRLLAFEAPSDPAVETWNRRVLTKELHVMHNFDVVDLDSDGQVELVAASYEGATWLNPEADGAISLRRLGAGQDEPAPKRGSSEIRLGRLAGGRNYLATVEPWHGDKVVVYLAPKDWSPESSAPTKTGLKDSGNQATSQHEAEPWPRQVIDDQLAWGHAVACANLDEDADEELIIGVRDDQNAEHRSGLRIYDPRDTGQVWERSIVDAGGVAIEDLTTADLDADGDIDIIAVGRATHNVKIYWNQLH